MPGGQSWWISRLVGMVVEGVTGDAQFARQVRVATRWGLAILTIDPAGIIIDGAIDEMADSAADEVIDFMLDLPDEEIADFGAEQIMSVSSGHLMSIGPRFGSRVIKAASSQFQAIPRDPFDVIRQLLEHSQDALSPEEINDLQVGLHGPREFAEQISNRIMRSSSNPGWILLRNTHDRFGGSGG